MQTILSKKKILFVIEIISIVFLCVGFANAASAVKSIGNSRTSVDENKMTINISFPIEGGVIYGDVIGSPITIYADVDSPNGIKEVRITNGINQSLCWVAIGHGFICQNPWQTGRNTIKITAYDNSGNVVSQTRNYSLVIGQNPPMTISTTPQNTPLSGFGFPLGISSVLISILIIKRRTRK